MDAHSIRRMRAGPAAPRPEPAAVFMVAGVIALAAYFALPLVTGGASMTAAQGLLYTVISAASGVAALLGVRIRRPARPMPWLVLAGAQFCTALADLVYYVKYQNDRLGEFPTVADVFYLLNYPLAVWALVTLVRRRTPGWQLPTLIDAAMVAVGIGLVGWVYVIQPMTAATAGSFAAKMVSVAYPVMDLLVLAIAVRLVLGAGAHPVAFYLLMGSLLAMFVADVIYAVQSLHGRWYYGKSLDGVWFAAYILLGTAALHPSMKRLDERATVSPPQPSPVRILVLALAAMTGPAVLLLQHLRGAPLHVVVVALTCAALSLLGLARVTELAFRQRRSAITDALTGVYNRRFFRDTLRASCNRSTRDGGSVGLLLVDADNFKAINDAHGHPVGDRVLRELAERLRQSCRPGDLIARYGGEEFAVLVGGADETLLRQIGERIRLAVAGEPIEVGEGSRLTVTISVGAALLPQHGTTCDEVIRLADEALYLAKRAGRNRVVTAPGPASPVN